MSFDWKYQKTLHQKFSKESTMPKGPSPLNDYKVLAQEAYSKKPRTDIGDWHLITHDRNNKVYQNRMTGEVVNGISGSKSIGDFANDGLQILGFRNNSLQKRRYAESELMMDRLNAIQRKPIVSTASHSLGSNISNRLFKDDKFDGNGYNFNGFYARNADNVDDSRITNVRNKGDLASYLSKGNENTIALNSSKNPITAHFIDSIKGLETFS